MEVNRQTDDVETLFVSIPPHVMLGYPLGRETIFGPCPGCNAWQLEAPADASLQEVEEVLAEHAAECLDLAAILAWKLSRP